MSSTFSHYNQYPQAGISTYPPETLPVSPMITKTQGTKSSKRSAPKIAGTNRLFKCNNEACYNKPMEGANGCCGHECWSAVS